MTIVTLLLELLGDGFIDTQHGPWFLWWTKDQPVPVADEGFNRVARSEQLRGYPRVAAFVSLYLFSVLQLTG